MKELAEASDRISIEQIGATHEDRPQLLLTITHPTIRPILRKIRSDHVWLTSP